MARVVTKAELLVLLDPLPLNAAVVVDDSNGTLVNIVQVEHYQHPDNSVQIIIHTEVS